MANNCAFEITFRNAAGISEDRRKRILNIFNGEDPEFCMMRSWGAAECCEGDPTTFSIEGDCAWSADMYWRPEDHTLYGGEAGKTVISVPGICRLLRIDEASGWEEEQGMGVMGDFHWKQGWQGVEYTDNWPDYVREMHEEDPDDEDWARLYRLYCEEDE